MELWAKYSTYPIINEQAAQDRFLEKISYLILNLEVSWGKVFKTFANTLSLGLISHQTHQKFFPLEITFQSFVQTYCLWTFAILNNYHSINGSNVIIKLNYREALCCSLVSREQRFWDTWSAPSQADAAFHLSGAVLYKLDCLDFLLDLHIQVCACSLPIR